MVRNLLHCSLLFVVCIVFADQAFSENVNQEKRGLVTTSRCPYTCKMAGVSSELCKEWRAGETCYVEDLTQAPGHRSLIRVPKTEQDSSSAVRTPKASLHKRGLVTSSSCPYDCRRAGVSEDFCRSWQAGERCYVEDYTQAPGHRSRLVVTR